MRATPWSACPKKKFNLSEPEGLLPVTENPLASLTTKVLNSLGWIFSNLVIKNGTVVTATDTFTSDVGIRGEKIAALADNLQAASIL